MKFTQHPSNNAVLSPPPGVKVEECRPLPVTRAKLQDGDVCILSYWQPSDEERAAIVAGALVQLAVWGSVHPPVLVAVDGVDGGVMLQTGVPQ